MSRYYPPLYRLIQPLIPKHYIPPQRRWSALYILEGDIYSRDLLKFSGKLQHLIENIKKDIALIISDTRHTSIVELSRTVINNADLQRPNNLLTK
ncbi:hypothetical protein [secondary endosymbiont of Heteropsylla cubana]|uniref:hypothetical protein n=1 Tax=secondary endosymbiont of Heteropsylla cubana TaxID=134287 RepID=UPI00135C5AA0